MSSATISEIEKRIDELSLDEQLRLLELLASRVRRRADTRIVELGSDLEEMAADPDIQRELQAIEEEFRVAEGDGLEAIG